MYDFSNSWLTGKKISLILCPNFCESCFSGSSQIPFPVKIFCVFPNSADYFSQIPYPKKYPSTPWCDVTQWVASVKLAPVSLFWPRYGLNKLPEVHFKFFFNLIRKSTMAILSGQSWLVLKSWYLGGGARTGILIFGAVSQRNLTQQLLSFICGAC